MALKSVLSDFAIRCSYNYMDLPPSLRCIRAFEAVARHRNVTLAAEELGVTQPAVTQQLRLLERHLGTRLVRADRRGIDLTAAGAALASRVVRTFDDLRDALTDAAGLAGNAPPLTLALLATLAQRWLIPRLPSFQSAYPDIEVRLLTTSRLVDLQREDVDLAIRVGDGKWPGCRSDFLFENALFPVASPVLLTRTPLDVPADLAHHVMQGTIILAADIHAGAAAHRLKAFEHLDVGGGVGILCATGTGRGKLTLGGLGLLGLARGALGDGFQLGNAVVQSSKEIVGIAHGGFNLRRKSVGEYESKQIVP